MKPVVFGAVIAAALIAMMFYVFVTGTGNWLERMDRDCKAQGGKTMVSGRDLVCVKEKEE